MYKSLEKQSGKQLVRQLVPAAERRVAGEQERALDHQRQKESLGAAPWIAGRTAQMPPFRTVDTGRSQLDCQVPKNLSPNRLGKLRWFSLLYFLLALRVDRLNP